MKPLKAFVHNTADSYLSTMYQLWNFYHATWIYKSAMDSGLHYLEIDIFNKRVSPNNAMYSEKILISIDIVEPIFVKMIGTSGITRESVKSLVFKFEFTEFTTDQVKFICKPVATDIKDKLYRGKPIEIDYPDNLTNFDNYIKSINIKR